jgi:DNA-nicking Smr family endonuclease
MKRSLRPEEVDLWTEVTVTVRPFDTRAAEPAASPIVAIPAAPAGPPPPPGKLRKKAVSPKPVAKAAPAKPKPPTPTEPQSIEPGRKRRIVRGRDEIAARLDLHGLDQDRARLLLLNFLLRQQEEGARSVLVITGKGYAGQGVLRRRTPEWLSDPLLRTVVAGLSPAGGHHGGEGAYYVALKRRKG